MNVFTLNASVETRPQLGLDEAVMGSIQRTLELNGALDPAAVLGSDGVLGIVAQLTAPSSTLAMKMLALAIQAALWAVGVTATSIKMEVDPEVIVPVRDVGVLTEPLDVGVERPCESCVCSLRRESNRATCSNRRERIRSRVSKVWTSVF